MWPGTKKVAWISSRASNRRIRGTPTRAPNSPREIAVGVSVPKLPIQTEIASKSKVRQTVGLELCVMYLVRISNMNGEL